MRIGFDSEKYITLQAERIRQRIKEGRWELQGGTWVEMDCNIPCGESLVRQFLHGKNFYRDEFGIEVRNLWLPDTFGYNGNLPQIMKLCRCDYFVTNKMAWNDTNRIPSHAFNWVGIDGTSVMAFLTPEGNYNAPMTPAFLNQGASRFSCPEILPGFLSLYGIGDGGGGPAEEYVERALRCANLEGCPKVRLERAQQFLDTLPRHRDQLPSWHGDLYLENHRGTLTTHADIKRAHRRCEELLLQTETLHVLLRSQAPYPRETLEGLWKKLMLNQFHDILPGSAIPEVYESARRDLQDIQNKCQALCDKLGFAKDTQNVTYFNTLGCGGNFLLELPPGWTGLKNNKCQQTPEGRIFCIGNFSPLGRELYRRSDKAKPMKMTVDDGLDNNGHIVLHCNYRTACFDPNSGRLLTVYDILDPAPSTFDGNCFALYRDYPTCHDAWNVEPFYKGERLPLQQRLLSHSVRTGPLFSELVMEIALGDLRIRQTVRICRDCAPVYFHTQVENWRQDHRMLRVSFRKDGLTNPVATCSTPFGAIEQPTHANTSWEEARFEVPMQQWVDVSEKDDTNGFAILNDSKYGVSVQDGAVDIDLLRAPTYPDPTADRGSHEFTFALMNHVGYEYRRSEVTTWAKALNRPPVMLWGDAPAHAWKLPLDFPTLGLNFYVEALKKAEKGEDIIFRVAEQLGQAETLQFIADSKVASVTECDMLEWEDLNSLAKMRHAMQQNGEAKFNYKIPFHPYEIKTFRVRMKK
ncbi:MAG: hypothetical protein IJJ33_12790 [Victivallales bacterium]|nr:hypothetical protein [Victivallales bacterium]